MAPNARTAVADRVVERRRAVALARHYREAEGLSIVQIADRLGRSPATIKAYFYDPAGEKTRAVKARYQGVCRGCGADTQPRNGKGDAYACSKAGHLGAIRLRWTGQRVRWLAWRRLRSYLGGGVVLADRSAPDAVRCPSQWQHLDCELAPAECAEARRIGALPALTAALMSARVDRVAAGIAVRRFGHAAVRGSRREP
jgi:hypothetical protein